MQKIPLSQIVDVTNARIAYRDEQGTLAYIDLELCAKRYAAAHQAAPSHEQVRCVGDRFFGEYAYYALYADEPVQICMNLKTSRIKKLLTKMTGWNFQGKAFEQFYSLQKKLNAAGWTTMDLS